MAASILSINSMTAILKDYLARINQAIDHNYGLPEEVETPPL